MNPQVCPILRRPVRLESEILVLPAPMVDKLYQVRQQLADLTTVERALTAQLIDAMQTVGLRETTGALARATLGERVSLVPDVRLFLELAGEAGVEALTVSVTKARELVGASTLAAISDTTTSQVLRVEAR